MSTLKSQKLIDMDRPSPRSVPPTERTIAGTHQISQIQQARYRHSRAVEEDDDEYSAVSVCTQELFFNLVRNTAICLM